MKKTMKRIVSMILAFSMAMPLVSVQASALAVQPEPTLQLVSEIGSDAIMEGTQAASENASPVEPDPLAGETKTAEGGMQTPPEGDEANVESDTPAESEANGETQETDADAEAPKGGEALLEAEETQSNGVLFSLEQPVTNAGTVTFSGGDGTQENPYQIATAEQFDGIRNNLSAHYILVNDIDLSVFDYWTPIGTVEKPFTGSLDGNSHKIQNVKIDNNSMTSWLNAHENAPSYVNIGLFGNAGGNAALTGVYISDCLVEIINPELQVYCGALCGDTGSKATIISGCVTTGNISLTKDASAGSERSTYLTAGGIVGYSTARDVCIVNCTNYVDVLASEESGGIIGYANLITIENCNNYGDIMGTGRNTAFVGGIAGEVSFAEIVNSVNYGNIYSKTTTYTSWSSGYSYNCSAGGIAGKTGYNIKSCQNFGDVSAVSDYQNAAAGGICGEFVGGSYGHHGVAIDGCSNYGVNISAQKGYWVDEDNEIRGYEYDTAGRICGNSTPSSNGNYGKLSNNYSLYSTLVNGVIPTDGVALDGVNGANLDSNELDVYKQFFRYDASAGAVLFTDGSSMFVEMGVTLSFNDLPENCWVKCTVTIKGTEMYLSAIEKIKPTFDVEIILANNSDILYNDGKLGYSDYSYEDKANFEIEFSIKVTNTTSLSGPGSSTGLNADDSLAIQIEDVQITPPLDFNTGWFGGGNISLDGSTILPGESITGEGYIRAGTFYKPAAKTNEYNMRVKVISGVGSAIDYTEFKIIRTDWDSYLQDEIRDSASKAHGALNRIQTQFYLDKYVMEDIFGIKGKSYERFKKYVLAAIVLSNVPPKTFDEEIDAKILEKVFGKYKLDVGADGYTVPLQYIIETPKYGRLTVRFDCEISSFSLMESRYALFASVGYKIVDQEARPPKKVPAHLKQNGAIGMATNVDIEAFSKAAYALAESEIKRAYNLAWGNSANQAAKLIFSDTINTILDEADTSVSNLTWKLITWPTKNIRNFCPTDIYIYDAENRLCGSIENNQVTLQGEDFTLSVDGDTKCIAGLENDYTVKYVATGDGVMDVEITENWGYESALRTIDYYDVPLVSGEEHSQRFSTEILPDTAVYQLVSGENVITQPSKEEMAIDLSPASISGITLSQSSATLKALGETLVLTAAITPEEAAGAALGWESSKPDVATVDSDGVVCAVANGTASITVTTEDGAYRAACVITVDIPSETVPLTGINIDEASITLNGMGAAEYLTLLFAPDTATNKTITWTSSAPEVASINKGGVVYALSSGSALITASSADGGYTDTCTVTVTMPEYALPDKADVNLDGVVSLSDAVLTARMAAELEKPDPESEFAADIYADGAVDVLDVIEICRIIVGAE